MTPAAAPRRFLHARRSSFPLGSRTQAVEPGENLGGLRFVTGLELGVVVVADVAGLVLELELPEHGQDLTLTLGQLLPRVRGNGQERAPAARAYQRPHREQQGGKADGEGDADDRHAPRSISRRMRSRIASVRGPAAPAEVR